MPWCTRTPDDSWIEKAKLDPLRPSRLGGELGVWMHTCGTGDALSTADALAGVGVTYVNTDFPESFLES